MQSNLLRGILIRLTDIEFNRWFFVKLGIVYITTILKFVSVLGQVRTQTELGAIITQSVHCLYCNPGFYPHGLLWYAIVIPIAYFGTPTSDLITFATVDMVILIGFINRNSLFVPFLLVSFLSYFVIPQNEPILWLTLFGLRSVYYLALPIIAKFPIGSELFAHPWYADWQYIFHTSLNIVTNFQDDYGVLVGFWLYILYYHHREIIKAGFNELRSRRKR